MDINSDEESSSIFQPFTTQSVSTENGIVTKSTEKGKTSSSKPSNNNDFDDCSQLPDGLKNCISTDLIGIPLVDIDPFYGNKETFIVVNTNKQLYRFSSTNAVCIFSPASTIRSIATRILVHPLYTKFMVAVILAFCFMKATTEPHWFDLRYFLIIFLLESLLKIISHGLLLSPFTYLRNGWNILDVVLNILLLSGILHLAELRILTIISYSLNLRKTIRLYWSSCKLLLDLIIYVGLMLAIISAFFLQVYMGTLTQSCVPSITNTQNIFTVSRCGNSTGSQACPDSYVCLQNTIENPDFGYTNFDTIFYSSLSTFRLMTRDFWEDVLHLIIATCGPWHIISFIGIIFIVSYQYLSLIWGQIAVSYNYLKLQRWERNLVAEDVETDDMTSQGTNNGKNAGCWSKFQRFVFFIIYNPYVVLFVIICIILNTFCMALDHHNMTASLDKFLRAANYIFVIVFVFEAILKLLALGVVRYFKDEWNTFDFVVTVLGAVELCLEGVQGLSVFRSFRLLRPLRLGKIVPAFDLLLTRMQHLFSVVAGQTIIFFMVFYIFVMFGCKQFGDDYKKVNDDNPDKVPLWNFTDVMHSFMVVFRALCGEWIETMFLCLQAASKKQAIIMIYYFLMVIVQSFQVMHIFTALLFTNDDSSAISLKPKSLKKSAKPKEKFQLQPFLKDKLLEPSIKKIYDEYQPKKGVESIENPTTKMVTKAVAEDDINESINNTDTSIPIEPLAENLQDNTLKTNKNKYFQHFVTLSVFVSSFTLAAGYGNHADSDSILYKISIYCDIIFIGLLSIELMTKLISRGWKNCITDFWYWVDLFNVITAVVGVFVTSGSVSLFTALRPLSLISRCFGLNLIANTIFKQMWFLSNTILVCLAFWLIFAIMGVQLFAGKFYNCLDRNGVRVGNESDIFTNLPLCGESGYEDYNFKNSFMNFDNVIDSYYSLLEVSTFKGWIGIISDAVDSREVHHQPIKETNIYMFLYFVIFIIFGVFLSVNVLVGILVQRMLHFGSLSDLLNQRKNNSGQSSDETVEPTSSNSKLVNFVRSNVFEMIALVSYFIYIIALMCDHSTASEEIGHALEYVHFVLSALLIIEVGLRCFAYRKAFFASYWNRFDIVVVILLIIDLFASDIIEKYFISVGILRMVRIFRFVGLIASFSRMLKCGGNVITKTWKTVAMLYLFLLLVCCVYALIGMALYKDVTVVFGSIDIINFNTFGQSIILLIQVSTGAGWDGLLKQISENKPGLAAAYMISFLYISFTIILNIIILIAFEFYKEVTAMDEEGKQLQPDDLNDFNEKWKRFAQNNQAYVPKERLSEFFHSLDATSSLRPPEYDDKEIKLLGIKTTKDDNYSRSALLIALNRIRLNKLQKQ